MANRTDEEILGEIAEDKQITSTTFLKCQLEIQLDIRQYLKKILKAVAPDEEE